MTANLETEALHRSPISSPIFIADHVTGLFITRGCVGSRMGVITCGYIIMPIALGLSSIGLSLSARVHPIIQPGGIPAAVDVMDAPSVIMWSFTSPALDNQLSYLQPVSRALSLS